MQKIVVYDLNKTLYQKSSKDEFFKFVCYKNGYKLIRLAQLGWLKMLGNMRLVSKTDFKENFYNYLKNLDPETVKKYAEQFWNLEYPEFFRNKMLEDIRKFDEQGIKVFVVTGGFEVYTKYLEQILPVQVLGTRTTYKNGNYSIDGKACNDEEKIRRLDEALGEYELLEAYSDDDEEILHKAKKGFLVDEESGELKQVN